MICSHHLSGKEEMKKMLTISLHSGYGVIWTYLLQDKKKKEKLFKILLVENITVYSYFNFCYNCTVDITVWGADFKREISYHSQPC